MGINNIRTIRNCHENDKIEELGGGMSAIFGRPDCPYDDLGLLRDEGERKGGVSRLDIRDISGCSQKVQRP